MDRRSVRLTGYDYSLGSAYFITLCTHNRICYFGRVVDGNLHLNPRGEMVAEVWRAMPAFNPGLVLAEFVVMPNHFHALLGYPDQPPGRGLCPAPTGPVVEPAASPEAPRRSLALPDIVRRFKTQTLKKYREGVETLGWRPYAGRLWQRGYMDHIIRGDRDLETHREYIYNNPMKWHLDRNNPQLSVRDEDMVP